jgi:outer membrane protein TolC
MLVASSWRAQAQEPLTLDRAIGAALIHNPSLRAARASGAEADAHFGEARSGFFPRLTLSESWQRSN